jgi:hypothetical protein
VPISLITQRSQGLPSSIRSRRNRDRGCWAVSDELSDNHHVRERTLPKTQRHVSRSTPQRRAVIAALELLHTEVLAWVSVPSDVPGIVLRRLTWVCAAGGDVGNGVRRAPHTSVGGDSGLNYHPVASAVSMRGLGSSPTWAALVSYHRSSHEVGSATGWS